MAAVEWIKVYTDMFVNPKIKFLRTLAGGNDIVLIWVMLLTVAGRCNAGGRIYLTESIPYTGKMLAEELGFKKPTMDKALQALEEMGMVHRDERDFLIITDWESHQNIEGMAKIRDSKKKAQARWRAKQKEASAESPERAEDIPEIPDETMPVTSTVDSTEISQEIQSEKSDEIESGNADKDKEKEIDKDIYKKENKKRKNAKAFSTDGDLNKAILAFIEFRKAAKKPMTDHAVELLLERLNKMSDYIPEQIEILNQSILKGWTDIYPLKGSRPQMMTGGRNAPTAADSEAIRKKIALMQKELGCDDIKKAMLRGGFGPLTPEEREYWESFDERGT